MTSKISVIGCGYVGMSLAILFAQKHNVVVHDVDKSKIDLINKGLSTVKDDLIEEYLNSKDLNLVGEYKLSKAIRDSDYIVISTPTNFDEQNNAFDTSSVDSVVSEALKINSKALIVIKSTIPIGHTEILQKRFSSKNIVFSPEFLREGNALKDNLYPNRIIVGGECKKSIKFGELISNLSKNKETKLLFMNSSEAEAVKLFSNTYLAMRVSFFNEMDTFCMSRNLSTKNVINGVSLDNRIRHIYNNPSFGYGGYCLPKDTKQLLSEFKNIPQKLVNSIIESNKTRKDFIASEISRSKSNVIGFYKLAMKKDSDNSRYSAIIDIMMKLKSNGFELLIYDPSIKNDSFEGINVLQDFDVFKKTSDIIVCNRNEKNLDDVKQKVFTRDVFGIN